MSAIEELLKRERIIVIAALATLTLLAWIYLWLGAGMSMTALVMTKLALFPHLTPEPMPDMMMPPLNWLTVVAMWWVMMIAMMTPSAAPFVLLYNRVVRHAAAQSPTKTFVPTALLLAGYLLVWLAFSLVATTLQYTLQRTELISPMMLWSKNALLSAAVLAAAGIYQLTPLKHACLKHCRNPVQLLTQRMRKGGIGAVRMGIEHGAWCVGCCWLLMALLFVGGVMNLAWIALLAMLVLLEKTAPQGQLTGRIVGAILLVWSAATLFV